MMVFLFFKIGQFLWEISPVFTVDLNIAKIVDKLRTVPKLFTKRNHQIPGQNRKLKVVSEELSSKLGNLKEKMLLTDLVSTLP